MPTQVTSFIAYFSDQADLTETGEVVIKQFGETEYNGKFIPMFAGLAIDELDGNPLVWPVFSIGSNASNYNDIAAAQTYLLILGLQLRGNLTAVSGYGGEMKAKITTPASALLGELTMLGKFFVFGRLQPN